MNEELKDILRVYEAKEILLNEIIVWLKAKGLWEECQQCCTVKVVKN